MHDTPFFLPNYYTPFALIRTTILPLACPSPGKMLNQCYFIHLSPHDALIKASFYIPENRFYFSTTQGFRMNIPMKLVYQFMAIFLIFPTTSNHLYPLEVEICDSNSRLVVDEDDNVKSGLKGSRTTGHRLRRWPNLNTIDSTCSLSCAFWDRCFYPVNTKHLYNVLCLLDMTLHAERGKHIVNYV